MASTAIAPEEVSSLSSDSNGNNGHRNGNGAAAKPGAPKRRYNTRPKSRERMRLGDLASVGVVYQEGATALRDVYIVAQARKKFVGIGSLAQNIARRGLLEPPIVALFDWEHFCEYIARVNRIHDTAYDPTTFELPEYDNAPIFIVDGRPAWPVLLAGERRFRALKVLWSESCDLWRREYGDQVEEGDHFSRRSGFEGGKIRVRFALNPSAVTATYIQIAENIHRTLRPEEEAELVDRLLRANKEEGLKIPLTETAAEFGKSPDVLRDRAVYCRLPRRIQEAVENDHLGFSASLHFGRWIERTHPDEEQIEAELGWAIRERRSVAQVSIRLKELSKAAEDEEPQFLDMMMTEAQQVEQRRFERRNGICDSTVRHIGSLAERLSAIVWLFKSETLSANDSPFRLRGVIAVYRRIARFLLDLNKHLENILPSEEVAAVREEINYTERLADLLDTRADREIVD